MSEGWRPVAPWRALYATLRAQIEDGTYPPKSRLPSIVQLSQQTGLSGKTVRKALDQLKQDGTSCDVADGDVRPGLNQLATDSLAPPTRERLDYGRNVLALRPE